MRASGILLHITSLPSPYGVGTMGKSAYDFVDFLEGAGQSYWQVLPVLTTSYGDSPYQSFSTFAGNPYLIDLDLLEKAGLLLKKEYQDIDFGDDPEVVDYSKLFFNRPAILRKAYKRGIKKDQSSFLQFYEQNQYWLEDFGLFMALKAHFDYKSYHEWPQDIRLREPEALATYGRLLADDIHFHQYIQYLFFDQWAKLKDYANGKGIKIIGDIPIYVADDSADEWSHRELFWLDENSMPVKVAGVPPDGFTADGQMWGNPLYLWDVHKAQKYSWWNQRMMAALEMYDVVRIDHFRGFESFFVIDYGEKTARNGVWMKGPGIGVFKGIRSQTNDFRIIAEDLGYMDDNVRKMVADSGYPGMKIMLFGFDAKGGTDDVPYKHFGNCVSYIGTHDNETFMGWIKSAPKADVRLAKRYIHLTKKEGYHWGAIRTLMSTGSPLVVMQMQDVLGLDNEARMNTPSTLGGNWQWRLAPNWDKTVISDKLRQMTHTYFRRNR